MGKAKYPTCPAVEFPMCRGKWCWLRRMCTRSASKRSVRQDAEVFKSDSFGTDPKPEVEA